MIRTHVVASGLLALAAAGAAALILTRRAKAPPLPAPERLAKTLPERASQPSGWLEPAPRRIPRPRGRAGLVDPASAELPVGRTADRSYDRQLSKSHLPQPESTGAALWLDSRRDDDEEAPSSSFAGIEADGPSYAARVRASGDDAGGLSSDELGAAFLARATESGSNLDDDADELEGLTEVGAVDALGDDFALERSPDSILPESEASPESVGDEDNPERALDDALAEVFDRRARRITGA